MLIYSLRIDKKIVKETSMYLLSVAYLTVFILLLDQKVKALQENEKIQYFVSFRFPYHHVLQLLLQQAEQDFVEREIGKSEPK